MSGMKCYPSLRKGKGLGSQNQVFLSAVGPLWNELSTGPNAPRRDSCMARKARSSSFLLWNALDCLPKSPATVGDA